MAKLAVFPLLLVAGCFTAGVYGALHDQISYTVSPDYFHLYKFRQFDIARHLHNRLGAALVGWYATWWMGFLIGIPVLIVGLILPDARTYLSRSLIAFGVVAITALVVGLGGLIYASNTVNAPADFSWDYPEGVTDPVGFARVGMMHSFGYLGGFLGTLTASAYLVAARIRLARRSPRGEAGAAESR